MARLEFSLSIALLLLVLGNVQSRSLRLISSKELVSGTTIIVDHLDFNSSVLTSKGLNSTRDECVHHYGFLPCATNIPGFVFQIAVLEYLLLVGDKILTKGRQQIFSILGVASGVAQNKKAAQARVENGVGSLAGSTIFWLTLQWGICVLLGRTKITKESSLPHQQKSSTSAGFLLVKQRLSILKEDCVETDRKTSLTAGLMLLSLIPFIMVEVVTTFKSHPWGHITTITVSGAVLVSYFIFQSRHQWIQERSLEFSRNQLLLAGFLNHLQKYAKKRLVNDEGKLDVSCIKRTFHTIDKNEDNCISEAELKDFVTNMKSGDLQLDEEFANTELMKHFDQDSDSFITMDEFMGGCQRFISEAKQMVTDKNACSRKYLPELHKIVQPWIEKKKNKLAEIEKQLSEILCTIQDQQLDFLLTDGKPDEAKIRSLFEEFDKDGNRKMSVGELKGMIISKFESVKLDHDDVVMKMMKAFDINKDDMLHEKEFLDGFKKRLSDSTNSKLIEKYREKKKRSIRKKSLHALIKPVLRVAVGVAIVSSLGLPLINNTQLLSEHMGIPSFFISFTVLPLAANFRTTMATVFPASQKKEEASSLTFSAVNN
ncbi:hypothetical protein GH714_003060 [Hevea brasiliensis]|uniref:EF-hand domain-containing protein n=1 Tax=Hevea brasiliensis TaxID=3981 RepID=A0A6A6LYT7_HEVBR|nr:hypothetical protein GH714_003060 [Hevea brasiliensis]